MQREGKILRVDLTRGNIREENLDPKFHRRSIELKRKLYPPLLLNMALVMGLFVSGGAADTRHIPGWMHGLFFCICFLHFLKTVRVEHSCFKENTAIILDMSGIKRP